MQGYVDFDRFNVLEASLEELLIQIQMEPMTTTSWKWALISAHAALLHIPAHRDRPFRLNVTACSGLT
jgi:hypothetical protein